MRLLIEILLGTIVGNLIAMFTIHVLPYAIRKIIQSLKSKQ